MAKRIVWSKQAFDDRIDILDYWINRNKSKTYSLKLNALFKAAIKIIAKHPLVGKLTEFPNVRAKIVRDYLIFYQELGREIHILSIWDGRRDPEKLIDKLK